MEIKILNNIFVINISIFFIAISGFIRVFDGSLQCMHTYIFSGNKHRNRMCLHNVLYYTYAHPCRYCDY